MSRPAARDNSTAVSLFPFLAVLLCTMGALVVLLVVMSKAARQRSELIAASPLDPPAVAVEAATQAEQEVEPQPEPVDEKPVDEAAIARASQQLEETQQRAAQLDAIREQLAETLRDDQARLSHIENHVSRLRDKLAELREAARELASLEETYQSDSTQAEQELEYLQELIADAEEEIERVEQEQAGKQKSYAILPYKGANGTRRRPIYIECLRDKVILQPEGITLEAIDFRPPLGVGNPLSAALRAARKHHLQNSPDGSFGPEGEPYPLVIVRPEGIELYHRVRAALESGQADFGYEMVDADWDLAFGLPSPTLANAEAKAIDAARIRRHVLAQAAPSAYESPGRSSFGAVTRGGGGFAPSTPGTRSGAPGGLSPNPYSANDTLQYGAANKGVNQSNATPYGSASSPDASSLEGQLAGQPGGSESAYAGGVATSGTEGSSEESFNAQGAAGQAESLANAQNHRNGQAGAAGTGSPSDANAESDEASQASEAGGIANNNAEQVAGQAGGQPGGPPTSSAAAASAAQSFSAVFNSQQGSGASGSGLGAERRTRRDAIAIRRSILLMVHNDRVVVTPVDSRGYGIASRATVVPLAGPNNGGLRPLSQTIRQHIDSWGIAGQGFYWKPVLVLSVASDGQQRANQLVAQIAPSGVEVRLQNTANANPQEAAGAQR